MPETTHPAPGISGVDPALRGMSEDPVRTNPRARRRRLLYLIGLVPLLAAVAFTAKVTVMRGHDETGAYAFAHGDGATTLEEYTANRSLNWFEPWIAHFDSGNGAFLLADYERALDLYDEALDAGVPAEHRCTVRINMALTEEKIGDRAAAGEHRDAARDAWKRGITLLEEGHCPTDAGQGEEQTRDSATVKKRLEEKLNPPQDPPPQKQQKPPPNSGRGGPGKKSEQQRKHDQLEQGNRRGTQDRQRYQDFDDYDNYGYEYQW